jgi:hypothetical protein
MVHLWRRHRESGVGDGMKAKWRSAEATDKWGIFYSYEHPVRSLLLSLFFYYGFFSAVVLFAFTAGLISESVSDYRSNQKMVLYLAFTLAISGWFSQRRRVLAKVNSDSQTTTIIAPLIEASIAKQTAETL